MLLLLNPGQYRTHELITQNYWWPCVMRDVRLCQSTKPRRTPLAAPHPHDLITPLGDYYSQSYRSSARIRWSECHPRYR